MKQIKKIQAKLPADPFEAELLAMAGAMVVDDPLDSEDSEDEPEMPRQQRQSAVVDQSQDMESEIQAGRVVPKPLPMPDPSVSPEQENRNGQKRRYSQSRGN